MQAVRAEVTLYSVPPLGFKTEIQGMATGVGVVGWVRHIKEDVLLIWVQHEDPIRVQVFFDLMRKVVKKHNIDISIDMHPHTPRNGLKHFVVRKDQTRIHRKDHSVTSGDLAFSDAGSPGYGSESEYLMMQYQRDLAKRMLHKEVVQQLEDIKERASAEARRNLDELIEDTRAEMEREKELSNLSITSNVSYIGEYEEDEDEIPIEEIERRMEQQRLEERAKHFGTALSTTSTSTVINIIMDEKQSTMINTVVQKTVDLFEKGSLTEEEYKQFLRLDTAKKLELYVLAESNRDNLFLTSLRSYFSD